MKSNQRLYEVKMSNGKPINQNMQELMFEHKSLTVNNAIKILLLICLKEGRITRETAELEFACIEEFWEEKPERVKS